MAEPVHPYRMTIRDIEAEALARLARKGYDWSGTLRGRRGRNLLADVARDTLRRAP